MIMRRVTHLGGAGATIGIALGLMALGGSERRAGFAAMLGNAISHVFVQVFKRSVARPRPCDANGVPLAVVALPDPFSFPSGHSAASFAVALAIALAHPLLAPLALGLATLVACSRVALRVHYASDVVAGVVLGIGGFLAAESLLN